MNLRQAFQWLSRVMAIIQLALVSLPAFAQTKVQPKTPNQASSQSPTVAKGAAPKSGPVAANSNPIANVLPELKIPPNVTKEQLEKLIATAKGVQPRSPNEYLAMQAAIRDASDILLKLIDKDSPCAEQAKLDSMTSSVSLLAADGPAAKEKTFNNVKQYLTSRKKLTLSDVQIGILTAVFLEMQPHKAPARETYELLIDLLKEDSREEMQALRQNLLANVRRLNLLGNKFDLEALAVDGSKVKTADFAGKFVIVDFFATWCEPCIADAPHIRGHFEKYGAKGLAVVGISLDEKKDSLQAYLQKAKLPWPIIHDDAVDPLGSIRMKFGIANLPTVLLLNKEGTVVSLEARGAELDRLMQRLFEQPTLADPPPATAPSIPSSSESRAPKNTAINPTDPPVEPKNAAKKGSVKK